MKAKKKPLETLKPEDLGVDVAPRLKTLKVVEPRQAHGRREGAGREDAGRQAAERSEGDLDDARRSSDCRTRQRVDPKARDAATPSRPRRRSAATIHVLVAGHNAARRRQGARRSRASTKVLHADAPQLARGLAENVAALVLAHREGLLAHPRARRPPTARTSLPRVAAHARRRADLATSPRSKRRTRSSGRSTPATRSRRCKSKDPIKVITVRTTGFDPVAATGGSAASRKP